MNINSLKLKDREQIFKIFEAMQYAFGREPKTEYEKQNQLRWIGEILKSIDLRFVNKIKTIKSNHQKEFQQSPIYSGLLDAYVKAGEAVDIDTYKQIYQDFQALQKQYKFDDNKQAYFDAGCALSPRFSEPNKLYVIYPIFLFTAYQEKGGKNDDHRGGYFFPCQELSIQEIKEIHQSNPELFKYDYVKEAYDKMIKKRNNRKEQ